MGNSEHFCKCYHQAPQPVNNMCEATDRLYEHAAELDIRPPKQLVRLENDPQNQPKIVDPR
jgi:hypothetical protein